MSRRSWKQWFYQAFRLSPRSNKKARRLPRVLAVDALDSRITPAVNAFFALGTLNVTGDNANNTIEVTRNAAGRLLVNGGAVSIKGGTPTVANTKLISVF